MFHYSKYIKSEQLSEPREILFSLVWTYNLVKRVKIDSSLCSVMSNLRDNFQITLTVDTQIIFSPYEGIARFIDHTKSFRDFSFSDGILEIFINTVTVQEIS